KYPRLDPEGRTTQDHALQNPGNLVHSCVVVDRAIILTALAAGLWLIPCAVRAQDSAARPQGDLPIITEVLYAVPKGEAGDATQDGSRHATGDEFVEIHNPTDASIRLAGWTITDRNAPDAGQFLFIFPEFRLGPGETLVVFNGLDQTIPGPVGTAEQPPAKPNDKFNNAWVFTAGNTSSGVGFANSGDWVCLRTAQGEVVSCVIWGNPDEKPPVADDRLITLPKTSRASTQRTLAGLDGSFEAHPTVAGLRYSPGTPPPPAAGRQLVVEPDR
ncbi:hypothetical protein MNBD_PLANCTO03-501, partial [hydrothermal vent metagenome]